MEKLEAAIDSFKNKKILVIGDVLLDKFTWGKIESLNPEQPAAPKVKIKPIATYTLGGAGNVANNISSLGAYCKLYGVIGKDRDGYIIKNLCEDRKISDNLPYTDNPTIMKERIMAHGQQIVKLEYGEWNLRKVNQKIQKIIIKNLEKELENYDFLILSDYNKGIFSKDFTQEIISLANSKTIQIHTDPKPCNLSFFKNCTTISPNEKEAEEMTKIKYSNGKKALIKMGKSIAKKINSQYVVITCGKDGVFGYDVNKKEHLMVKTKAREVSDVSGAGDTFAATLPLALASGLNLFDSIILSNYASGIVVGKVGTATPTIEEIKTRIREDHHKE